MSSTTTRYVVHVVLLVVTVTERQVDGVYNAAQRYTCSHVIKLSLGTFVLLCVI